MGQQDRAVPISFRIAVPLELLPLESLHCVSRTTNSNTPVVFVKQPLFHLVLPEYPSSTLCSISKCRFLFFSFFLAVSLSLSLSRFLSSAYLTLYPHYFFLVRLIPGILISPRGKDVAREKERSIEYRLRSI